MRQCLVELGAEDEQLTGRRLIDIIGLDMRRNANLGDRSHDAVGVLNAVIVVDSHVAEVFQSGSISIVAPNQRCEDC